MTTPLRDRTATVGNVLSRYYPRLARLAEDIARERAAKPTGGNPSAFTPAFTLPASSEQLDRLFEVSDIGVSQLPPYRGVQLGLLDLMRNPATRTTKTLASLLMVARAVGHIRSTGKPITLLTPSSANKATALRDAVHRALQCGLATPEELNIATVVPASSRAKLWSSGLATDPELRRRNPVLTFAGTERAGVKQLALQMLERHGETYYRRTGRQLWYTLDLDNYRLADAVRAWVEAESLPPRSENRVHVHAVSSGYGLLGHQLGCTAEAVEMPTPQYFLVQHLDTPDMVLSLHFGSTDRANLPRYAWDETAGVFRQDTNLHFPKTCFDPLELIDPTFYTHNPPTSAAMNELIRRNGGGGIVVSLPECLSRYGQVRALLAAGGIELPPDPRELREWSLAMAATGLLEAIDRGLITGPDVLLHASGSYSVADYDLLPDAAVHGVSAAEDVLQALLDAA